MFDLQITVSVIGKKVLAKLLARMQNLIYSGAKLAK
jgi:hypothetical protein